MSGDRAAYIDYFPGFARQVAGAFNLTTEDIGLPSGADELRAYAAEYWDLRHWSLEPLLIAFEVLTSQRCHATFLG